MKYRAKAGKIKYEHGMIQGLREFLESLQKVQEIKSMIPGEIKPVKKVSSQLIIRRVTPTSTGLKALAHSGGAVQEVFFVGEEEFLNNLLKPFMKE
ncbi:MAG: DUF2103 domain-containing protein [Candidatus Caenarcaniphilales bacterium]|nr:DUF2103 domain-containing protein [Candidatus Caenarcaniphilales bacterium]